MANTPLEKGSLIPSQQSEAPLAVVQPSHMEFAALLEDIGKITEHGTEDHSGDWSGSGGKVATRGTQAASTQVSPRDRAIANLPVVAVMQKELEKHIQQEVKKLRRQAKSIARISHPGAAYRLNQLYSRIHRLNAILAGLFEASVDVVKRLFIRVFVDRQTIQ